MTKKTMWMASLLILVVAACGDDAATATSAATTTAPTTTTTTPVTTTSALITTTTQVAGLDADGRIAQATVVRQFLFDTIVLWGEVALDTEALAGGIRSVYPVDVRGGAVDADADGISVFSNPVDDKDVAGPGNPWVVAVVVADTTGECLGGIVFGYPAPDTVLDAVVPQGAPCQARVVHDMAELLIDLAP